MHAPASIALPAGLRDQSTFICVNALPEHLRNRVLSAGTEAARYGLQLVAYLHTQTAWPADLKGFEVAHATSITNGNPTGREKYSLVAAIMRSETGKVAEMFFEGSGAPHAYNSAERALGLIPEDRKLIAFTDPAIPPILKKHFNWETNSLAVCFGERAVDAQ